MSCEPGSVTVRDLGKRYQIGKLHQSTNSLREALVGSASMLGRRVKAVAGGHVHFYESEELWALRQLDLDVQPGDVLGVIGTNGAGKSTFLKVLARITEPTTGQAVVGGRLSALLEVGTGFHGELSGRDNIYLNGAILGMQRQDIRRRFDEIVEFSGVGKFLDTPVKRYSSGMFVRLAFSVAAHMEPDVLLIDEVLAVGDIGFQRKCLTHMEEVASGGRTVLFVSHNMMAVRRLCTRVAWLESGRLRAVGPTSDIVTQYERSTTPARTHGSGMSERDPSEIEGKQAWIARATLANASEAQVNTFDSGEHVELRMVIEGEPTGDFTAEWILYGDDGQQLSYGGSYPSQGVTYPASTRDLSCDIGPLNLAIGDYRVALAIRVWGEAHWDFWADAFELYIVSCDRGATGFAPLAHQWGPLVLEHEWQPAASP
jgi:lipopolysaccharide transport system ATP-binding protein